MDYLFTQLGVFEDLVPTYVVCKSISSKNDNTLERIQKLIHEYLSLLSLANFLSTKIMLLK